MANRFGIAPGFAYGRLDPLLSLGHLTAIYRCLADNTVLETQKRAENAMFLMVTSRLGSEFMNHLPIGLAAPLREAARTCQLAPPGDWPLTAYHAIGRNDLAASASDAPDLLFSDGYRPVKDFIVSKASCRVWLPTSELHFRLPPSVVDPLARSSVKLEYRAVVKSMQCLGLKLICLISRTYGLARIAGWRKSPACCVPPKSPP